MRLPSVNEISVATRQVATKSALNPMLWVCGLTTPSSVAAAFFSPTPINYLFFGLACLPVVYAVRAYEHFMKNEPDRLQSERYLLEREMVGMIGVNTPNGPLEIIIDQTEASSENPALLQGGPK